MLLLSALISGIGLGSMYGLMALGFYVTYAVSGTVNFAQGSSMMLGAVLTYALRRRWAGRCRPPSLAPAAVRRLRTASWNSGGAAIRQRGSDAWLMATVALGIVLDNLVMFTFGKEPRSLPSPLAQSSLDRRRRRAGRLPACRPADPDCRPGAGRRAAHPEPNARNGARHAGRGAEPRRPRA
jgi:branched-chain amino acid transport system permease protein